MPQPHSPDGRERLACPAADSMGTIEEGKVADMVLMDADPLADMANTKRIVGVVAAGRWYDRAGLDAMLEAVAEAVRR